MIVIDRKATWIFELAWLVAFLAELGHERAIITREYLHSMIVGVCNEQETSMMVEHQATRHAQQAISTASMLGADREQEREIDRRQEHQSIVGVGDDDATMMLVDRNASGIVELEIS